MIYDMRFDRQIKRFWKKLGPGFITGAADDDPSGIATYSIAGAQFGSALNWMALFLIPAMFSIQEMCGRIGMHTGRGLAGTIKQYHSKTFLYSVVFLLVIANVINIGADLGIMTDCLVMLFGINHYFWIVISAIVIIGLEVGISYKRYSKFLKWMALILFVYVVTAFLVKQQWTIILYDTFIPHIDFHLGYMLTMVGFLGTTISPYLFFWQASEQVEEEIDLGKITDFRQIPKIFCGEIKRMEWDTMAGMIFSNIIAFFILVTTTATLHNMGITTINSPQEAALALKPLAGNFAYIIFSIGIIGIGLQSIPILSGSVGYALAETFDQREGLSKKFNKAKMFYIVIALATGIGALLNFLGVNTIQALYGAAIINGVVAVPLIPIIIKLADNKKIVGRFATPKKNRIISWITFFFMMLAVLVMIFGLIFSKIG